MPALEDALIDIWTGKCTAFRLTRISGLGTALLGRAVAFLIRNISN